MIKCEWIDKRPDFKKDVKLEAGTKIGTIHALTKSDYSIIYSKSNGYKNLVEVIMWKIIRSLTGHGCKWELDKELSYETLSIVPQDIYIAFARAIDDFEKQNEVDEDIVKN